MVKFETGPKVNVTIDLENTGKFELPLQKACCLAKVKNKK